MSGPPRIIPGALAALLGLLVAARIAGAQAVSDTAASGLGPTSAPPWNPPRAIPSAEAWETAVRLPGRIVSLPISGLGWLTRNGLLKAEENYLVPRALFLLAVLPATGIAASPASLGDRTGIGGKLLFDPPLPGWPLLVELSGSTRAYSASRVAQRFGPAALEYANDWRPRDRFFGLGLQSSEHDSTHYAWQRETARLRLDWPLSPPGARPARVRASAWAGPRSVVVGHGSGGESTPTELRFKALAGPTLNRRFEHLTYGARAALDFRGGVPHWSHGWRLSLAAERFDKPLRSFKLHTPRTTGAQFTRYALDAEAGVSFMRDPRTLRLAFHAVDNELSAGPAPFVIPDLARLGGADGLAGFEPHRFHDLDAMVLRLSYIFPLAQHYEFDLHAEAGGVYPDMQHDAHLDTMKGSYGAALRPRGKTMPFAALGVEWSGEAVRFRYSVGGVE